MLTDGETGSLYFEYDRKEGAVFRQEAKTLWRGTLVQGDFADIIILSGHALYALGEVMAEGDSLQLADGTPMSLGVHSYIEGANLLPDCNSYKVLMLRFNNFNALEAVRQLQVP